MLMHTHLTLVGKTCKTYHSFKDISYEDISSTWDELVLEGWYKIVNGKYYCVVSSFLGITLMRSSKAQNK